MQSNLNSRANGCGGLQDDPGERMLLLSTVVCYDELDRVHDWKIYHPRWNLREVLGRISPLNNSSLVELSQKQSKIMYLMDKFQSKSSRRGF